jgi:hypothetical protein
MKRDQRVEAAAGPATREQLERWAEQYDRTWDRIVRAGAVVFALGILGLAGLAATEGLEAFKGARSSLSAGNAVLNGSWWLGLVGLILSLACALTIVWLWCHFVLRSVYRPMNPYRPSDITISELERANAGYPSALAYLDAIRQQHRSIVQHDIDVLATLRERQRANRGGDQ